MTNTDKEVAAENSEAAAATTEGVSDSQMQASASTGDSTESGATEKADEPNPGETAVS